jgi:hypothetical protein
MGATLISIHSAEENKFAKNLINKVIWIGAKRNNSMANFEWTNGEKFNYMNWASGQPKNSTDPESHVCMYSDGTWAAFGKDPESGMWYTAPYICQRDSASE